MNPSAIVAAAAATLLSTLAVTTPAAAQSKERCYGVAAAGQNDCANLSGSHSCAGQSKTSGDVSEWKYVAKGTCASLKGLSADEARAKLKG